jgi:hypothetical protein
MDAEFFASVNALLEEADADQRDFELSHPAPPQPEPKPTRIEPVTKAQDWSAWDRWCLGHIKNALADFSGGFAGMIGGEVGLTEKRIKEELREEFQIELGKLRADLTVQRAADRDVADLGSWRHRDVA